MSEVTNIPGCQLIFAKNSSDCHHFPYYFMAFSFSINLLLGLPANCYIMWLIINEMLRGQSLEVFVFNTSLAEVIFNFSYHFLIKQYFFKCSDCSSITLGFALMLLVGHPLFQTCICVERYVGVLHPVTFLKLKPIKYRITLAVIRWILIIFSCIVVALEVFEMHNLILPGYVMFLIIKVFTCLMVLKALKHPGPGDDVKQRDGVNQDEVKVFQIIQVMLVSSVLTHGPVTISLVLYYILDYNTFLMSWVACMCLGTMLGFVQPFLYLKRVRKVPLFWRLKICS